MENNCQKIKLLRIIEILRDNTDENTPMKKTELLERLADMGVSCDQRTLAKDIALLNEQGYEIVSMGTIGSILFLTRLTFITDLPE